MTDLEAYRKILTEYWGYTGFRPLQEEIIEMIALGKDTLALMPTGGGKSLTFQIPALAKPGVCLVVTPLIALMRDQVDNLRKRGIKAVAIHSGLSSWEIDIALDNCIYGDYKLLYLSPERLATDLFLKRLENMEVNLLAVDEAHCISQWGYDFRPSYLQIASIRKLIPEVPVLALTATATPGVAEDIMEKLHFREKNLLKHSFERKNLIYLVRKTEDKNAYLLKIFRSQKGSGIVYVRNRKKTEEIAAFLTKNNIPAIAYHAGMETKIRYEHQSLWTSGKTRVIAATNAFGMGIDKEDVRTVIHYELTDSPEAYFQEAGRAGRDGRKSYGVLLYHPSDRQSLEKSLAVQFPDLETIRKVYHSLGSYFQLIPGAGKGQAFDFDLMDFSQKFGFYSLTAFYAIKHLERAGYLELTDEINLQARVHFRMGRDDLYRFQVANDKYDGMIKTLLRAYSGLFTDFVQIDEPGLASKVKTTRPVLVQALENLQRMGVIYYLKPKVTPQLIFTAERLDDKSLLLSKSDFDDRKETATVRLRSMIRYAEKNDRCRSQFLLMYFGEADPFRCRQCDVCLLKHEAGLNKYQYDLLVDAIRAEVLYQPVDRHELIHKLDAPAEHVALVLDYLIQIKQIKILKGLVHWKESPPTEQTIF